MEQPKKARPKNWLLIKSREWHTWLGVILSVVIVAVCVTGIYLNHEHFFDGLFSEKSQKPKKAPPALANNGDLPQTVPEGLYTTTPLGAFPVSFSQALESSREMLGDVALKQIELKDEHGTLIYKIKAQHEEGEEPTEVWVDAYSGTAKLKEPYNKADGAYDWGKVLKDIHTGKIGGDTGRLLIDVTSLTIIFLTVTGIYLWALPRLRKRQNALAKNQSK